MEITVFFTSQSQKKVIKTGKLHSKVQNIFHFHTSPDRLYRVPSVFPAAITCNTDANIHHLKNKFNSQNRQTRSEKVEAKSVFVLHVHYVSTQGRLLGFPPLPSRPL